MAIIKVLAPAFGLNDFAEAGSATRTAGTATAFTFGWPSSPGPDGMDGTGIGLTYSGNTFTGGTITSVTYRGFEGTTIWTITGLTLSASAYQNAVNSWVSTGSIGSLLTALSGNAITAYGSMANDDFQGGALADNLRGDWGDDTFTGHNGADVIVGGPAFGVIAWADDFGDDYDTVNYFREAGTGAINVNMTLAASNVRDTYGAYDSLSGIENIIGTSRADTFRGSDTTRYESFVGMGGNDTINGGAGVDDEVRYDREGGTLGISVNLVTGVATDSYGATDSLSGIERIRGTMRGDNIVGNDADNRFRGYAGNDTINGGNGIDTVQYHADADQKDVNGNYGTNGIRVDLTAGYARDGFKNVDTLISIENVWATNSMDRIIGNASANYFRLYDGHDYAMGMGGNDLILGHDGNDSIFGGIGNDSLDGGNMADVLNGGAGVDTLIGGRGWDTFQFDSSPVGGVDLITDFLAIDDTIALENAVFTGLTTVGTLAATAFVAGTAATTAAHRIIYNQATGALLYDADGTGATAAVQFATLTTKPTGLTAADFLVY